MREPRRRTGALRLPLGPRIASPVAKVAGLLSLIVVAASVAAAMGPWVAWARAIAVLVLVAVAGTMHHVLSRRRRPPRGWLVVDEQGMRRVEAGRESTLAEWREPFGATVLASADRGTFVVALTSARATRFVSARVTDAEDAARAPNVIERATTAAESDLRGDDGAALSAADAEKLLAAIALRSPAALDRLFLSDASGEPVVLDRAELRVGTRRIDLAAPLEWRAFVFQELGAHAASVCQATWVRQGEGEVVLVAPMAADGTWLQGTDSAVRAAGEGAHVQRCVARDARLMQATVGEPPPRELRRAIDRLFMLPLRRALDRAPRASRAPSPPTRPMPEGRA